ncbi:hypothetical protein CSC73_00695 [Pseudoxanthomonas sacheonensis]|nr:hypothetical protein CSC73_00695 [Pseudoxanthomonas sacheonensis]
MAYQRMHGGFERGSVAITRARSADGDLLFHSHAGSGQVYGLREKRFYQLAEAVKASMFPPPGQNALVAFAGITWRKIETRRDGRGGPGDFAVVAGSVFGGARRRRS